MSKKITINLNDSATIRNAIKEINNYINDLESVCELFVEELANKGVEIAKSQIQQLDAVFTGELMASTKVFKLPKIPNGYSCLIINDSEHAAFVEFGTGWGGYENPYPYPLPPSINWEYVVGDQILANAEKGVYGWWYKGDDGKSYFTYGMESRPFMTNTSIQLMDIVEQTARKVFRLV